MIFTTQKEKAEPVSRIIYKAGAQRAKDPTTRGKSTKLRRKQEEIFLTRDFAVVSWIYIKSIGNKGIKE